ncbi:MAG: serine/threonine-protein kinase [Verrucomicrobia bacterium]|nr:serine/threonine-protein kinase [Verrucomicrobiota bacterium]
MRSKPSIEELFSDAAGIADPEERSAYLHKACGDDPALRRQIESLLASHGDSQGGAGKFSPPETSSEIEIGEKVGDQVGLYVLRERLGEGGFGVVFAAEQVSPIKRTVALKILKPGMDARQIILRFEQERQTLALMDHPHIARVLDAGTTTIGRPFFVMELAKGQPITRFCNQHRLKIPERIRLFAKVCRAVHHAHQKGIIHRDLKPSNILVDLADGGARPKVIDFGIAKVLHGKLTEETIQTVCHQLLGTPAYMSPEQALSGGQNVDTRSDTYSLGVLLFELLAGVTPMELSPRVETGRWRELMSEVAVVKPSTRFNRLPSDAANRIATDRGVNPGELAKLIGRDLDWIALKATAKEPNQRYESAEELGREIERFLENRPIEARPPSAVYLTGRFVRRHRLVVAGAAVVVMALGVGAGAAGWGWWVAKRESEIAKAESQKAQQLNDILFLGLLRADPGQGGGKSYTVREFLDHLGRDVDGRKSMTPDVECALRDMLSFIYRETGDYRQALHHGQRGLQLTRTLPDNSRRLTSFLMTLGEVSKELGDYGAARSYLDECLSVRRRSFGEDDPDVIRTVLSVARVRYKQGDRAGGLAMASDALAQARLQQRQPWGDAQLIRCLNMKEMMLRDERRFAEAAALNQERLELTRSQRGETHAETLLAQTHLGSALTELNRLEEARQILSVTLQRGREHLGNHYPQTLETMIALADCQARLGNVDEAAALYDEAIAHAGNQFKTDYPDRLNWIRRAIQFNEAHGRTQRAAELAALLPAGTGMD